MDGTVAPKGTGIIKNRKQVATGNEGEARNRLKTPPPLFKCGKKSFMSLVINKILKSTLCAVFFMARYGNIMRIFSH